MSEKLLEVSGLRVYFHTDAGVVPAVDGVSFSVDKGKTLSIVGESGCGKTVTSLSILQLLTTKTGKIEDGSSIKLKGRELVGISKKELQNIRGNEIAMIFQDSMTALNPVMTIEKQMIEPFMLHQHMSKKEAKKQAVEMLKKVGIPSPEARIKEYPHQLSGGMRQRVMIAMALSCNPEILIADEPTTALDVTIQAQIMQLMRELKANVDAAIILITHDLGVVADMADDILVMYTGRVMEYADKRSLFKDPLHPYTEGLLASIPKLNEEKDELYAIKGSVPNLLDMPAGCSFYERCPYAKEMCAQKCPDLYSVGQRKVRCFKYSEEWGEAK